MCVCVCMKFLKQKRLKRDFVYILHTQNTHTTICIQKLKIKKLHNTLYRCLNPNIITYTNDFSKSSMYALYSCLNKGINVGVGVRASLRCVCVRVSVRVCACACVRVCV
eukprot:GHVR01004829.1.p1 GENE.GHVR01004829.1~~GHVR01004829.1.p1  ORF type:complete len:109 (-),score=27.95 GHVR01004829.1:137-463(-)